MKDIRHLIQSIESISNPVSFAYHCGKNLVVNSVDIFRNSKDLIHETQEKHYLKMGQEIGKILEEVLVGNVRLAFESDNSLVQLFEGIVVGFGDEVSVDFAHCIQDAKKDWALFDEAMKHLDSKKPKQIKEGIEELGKLAKSLPKAIETCKGSKEDFLHLLHAAKALEHPAKFAVHVGKDLWVNGKDIFKKTEDLVKQYHGKHYLNAGVDIGEILAEVLVGKMAAPVQIAEVTPLFGFHSHLKEVVQTVEGVLLGFGSNTSLNFDKCVRDGTLDFQQFDEAI